MLAGSQLEDCRARDGFSSQRQGTTLAQTYQTCWSHGQLREVPRPHGLSFASLFRVYEMQGFGISSLPDRTSM